eukprot:208389_1
MAYNNAGEAPPAYNQAPPVYTQTVPGYAVQAAAPGYTAQAAPGYQSPYPAQAPAQPIVTGNPAAGQQIIYGNQVYVPADQNAVNATYGATDTQKTAEEERRSGCVDCCCVGLICCAPCCWADCSDCLKLLCCCWLIEACCD